MKRAFDLRITWVVFALALAGAATWHALAPRTYVASARVMVEKRGAESRIVRLQSTALDPTDARSGLAHELARYAGASILDAPVIIAAKRSLALDLGIGAALGLAFGAALTFRQSRRRRPVRVERDLVPVLGNPLLGARPHQPEALRALAQQLRHHWLNNQRKLLPIVSVGEGDGRSAVAIELARILAGQGERTLLVDANLRAPCVHRAFRLPNERGLADLLDDRAVQLAAGGENLAVLVAGTARRDPLELLSRPRLTNFLQAAARPFDVVLIDTPAAESGPDLEMFAALAGGALLVVRPGEDATRLSALRRRMTRCKARPVATVFER